MKRWLYLLCSNEMPYLMSRRRLGSLPQQKQTCEPYSYWSLLLQTIKNSSNLSFLQVPSKYFSFRSTSYYFLLLLLSFHFFFCLRPQVQVVYANLLQNYLISFRYFTLFECIFSSLFVTFSLASSVVFTSSISQKVIARKGRLTPSLKLIKAARYDSKLLISEEIFKPQLGLYWLGTTS